MILCHRIILIFCQGISWQTNDRGWWSGRNHRPFECVQTIVLVAPTCTGLPCLTSRWLVTCIKIHCVVMKHEHESHISWRRLQVHEQQSERQRKNPFQKANIFHQRAQAKLLEACSQETISKCFHTNVFEFRCVCCLKSFGLQEAHKYNGASGYKEAYMDGVAEYNSYGFAATSSKLQVDENEALELYGLKVPRQWLCFQKFPPFFRNNSKLFCNNSGSSS